MADLHSLSPEHRLERGDVVVYEQAPFALPAGEDLAFLLGQRLGKLAHKNISFNPHTGQAAGYSGYSNEQKTRLTEILAGFSRSAIAWVEQALPAYVGGCVPDRVSFRPEEEATRKLRQNARNDLLHVDAFPGRPARGRRILRVFANINPRDPRVWITAGALPELVQQYRAVVEQRIRKGRVAAFLVELFRSKEKRRETSDWFMLHLHDYLKANQTFQETTSKRRWNFAPGTVWLAMTDACSHAVLRGQYALEHSFFISPEVLTAPELSPRRLLAA